MDLKSIMLSKKKNDVNLQRSHTIGVHRYNILEIVKLCGKQIIDFQALRAEQRQDRCGY